MTWAHGGLLLAVSSIAAACVDSTGPPFPHIEETDFAPELEIDLHAMTKAGGGVYVQDLTLGSGVEVFPVNNITASFTLHLADGTLVMDRRLVFPIGCRRSVPGFETGITGMRVGGTRKIVVPGRLGYSQTPWQWGWAWSPPPEAEVPRGAILIFEAEILDSRRPTDGKCPPR